MTISELYLGLSMDLKWYSPQIAKEFVNSALQSNLLVKKGGVLTPAFNVNEIVLPMGFRPSKEIIYKQKEDVKKGNKEITERIVKRIAKDIEKDPKDLFEKIKEIEKEKNVFLDVAALLIGRKYNIILDDFFEGVEHQIFKDST